MEADYGKLFLSNYQITLSILSVVPQALRADAAPELASRGQQRQQVQRPVEVPKLGSEANVFGGKPTQHGNTTSSVFPLMSPPPIAAMCSVGSMSPESQVVVIDILREEKSLEKALFANDREFVGPMPASLQEDDEDDGLLGTDAADTASGSHDTLRLRIASDGVDSNSESDAEGSGRSLPPRQHPPGSPLALKAVEGTFIKTECSAVEPQDNSAAGLVALRPAAAASPSRGAVPPQKLPAQTLSPDRGGSGEPPFFEDPGRWPLRNISEVELQVAMNLDRFFNDDQCWEQVAMEVASSVKPRSATADLLGIPGACAFRVQVPKPYPGVQYRRSKDVEDRYPHFAKPGTIVMGQMEDAGEWLRIDVKVFLPMKVGNILILEPVAPEASANAQESTGGDQGARWWTCGPDNQCDQKPERTFPGRKEAEVAVQKENSLHVPESLRQQVPPKESRGQTTRPASMTRAQQGIGQHCVAAPPLPNGTLPGVDRGRIEESAAVLGPSGKEREEQREDVAKQMPKQQSSPLKSLPQSISKNPLADMDAAKLLLSVPIDPFSDSPRGGSPAESPLRSRKVSMV